MVDQPGSRLRRRVVALLRFVVSIVLIAILVNRVGLEVLANRLISLDGRFLAVAAGFQLFGVIISTLKWQWFLEAEHGPTRFTRLLRFYLVGSFFNNFLPSSVGGDVVRMWQASAVYGRRSAIVRSILLERLSGVAAILILCLATAPFLTAALPALDISGFAGIIGLIGAAMIAVLVTVRFAPRLVERVVSLIAIPHELRSLRLWFAAMTISFIFQINAAVIVWFVGRSLALPTGLWPVVLCMPLISLLSMMPITVNGFGLREGAFVALFGLFGVPAEASLAWSITVYLTVAAVSLVGGVMYALQTEPLQTVEG